MLTKEAWAFKSSVSKFQPLIPLLYSFYAKGKEGNKSRVLDIKQNYC